MAYTAFTVIIPRQLTEASLISSTIAENEYPVWNSGTNYNLADRVIVTTGIHMVYECTTSASSQGHYPPTNPAVWTPVGPTNRWAMFDQSGGTITTATSGSLTYSFTADRVTSLGFLDLKASSVTVQASTVADGIYYNKTFQIPDRAVIANWYDYFTAESFRATELILTDIPAITGTTFTISISNTSGSAQIGNFVFGTRVEIGKVQYGATAGIIDYSVKSTNEFGTVTIVQRAFSKRMDVKVYVDNGVVDSVAAKLNQIRATPVLWVGGKGVFECLTVYGFYKDYSVDISYPSYSVCSLQIEGMV